MVRDGSLKNGQGFPWKMRKKEQHGSSSIEQQHEKKKWAEIPLVI
jgi:hypothetical protein